MGRDTLRTLCGVALRTRLGAYYHNMVGGGCGSKNCRQLWVGDTFYYLLLMRVGVLFLPT